ncbi:hypothetical protein ZEAMMB73_Zm00001d023390 [Zea mays]|uniref:DUF668 family protein n=1 Tax=Zea mays TaxID=4577 RepID=K7TIJ3_MAIZE|nr:hypothetical protein ZEAMMB73_Zm00001d023390 [Zea mays]|eukprot:XP_008663803.1 uncharacterized protein LOC103642269 [Zea mays]
MRKLSAPRGGGEKLGVLGFEVAALMSRAAGLWRALDDHHLARLRGEAIRLEGVRRLVADDDAALLALALAEMAAACRDLSRAVARLSARCADPLLRRFDALFAALLKRRAADPHGLRYAARAKMDRKARKMQRLVAATAHLCHELDVLADLEQQQQQQAGTGAGTSNSRAERARRVARQRQEVERIRAASLWPRTFDYAVRLLARSLFTIVARIIEVFDLDYAVDDDEEEEEETASSRASRLSWGSSFVSGSMHMVYPSDVVVAGADAPRTALRRARSGKTAAAATGSKSHMSRSKSLRQQLRWPAAAGKHLIGCVVVTGSSRPQGRDGWIPQSFSYVSDSDDHSSGAGIMSFHSLGDGRQPPPPPPPTTTTSVFDASRDALAHPPEASLGGAGLALHYANLIMFIDRLAAAPHHIRADERDALYGMLTGSLRASVGARLRPSFAAAAPRADPALWADTVRRTLAWLAPLARNTARWQAERSFGQRSVAPCGSGGGGAAAVLLLQTLHFADRGKTEAAVTDLLVGLNYVWRDGAAELDAKLGLGSESAAGRRRRLR